MIERDPFNPSGSAHLLKRGGGCGLCPSRVMDTNSRQPGAIALQNILGHGSKANPRVVVKG